MSCLIKNNSYNYPYVVDTSFGCQQWCMCELGGPHDSLVQNTGSCLKGIPLSGTTRRKVSPSRVELETINEREFKKQLDIVRNANRLLKEKRVAYEEDSGEEEHGNGKKKKSASSDSERASAMEEKRELDVNPSLRSIPTSDSEDTRKTRRIRSKIQRGPLLTPGPVPCSNPLFGPTTPYESYEKLMSGSDSDEDGEGGTDAQALVTPTVEVTSAPPPPPYDGNFAYAKFLGWKPGLCSYGI